MTGKTVAEKNEIIEVNEKGKYRELMKIILTRLKSTMLSLDQIYYDACECDVFFSDLCTGDEDKRVLR